MRFNCFIKEHMFKSGLSTLWTVLLLRSCILHILLEYCLMVTFKFNQPKHIRRYPHSREKLLNFVLNFLKKKMYMLCHYRPLYIAQRKQKVRLHGPQHSLCLRKTLKKIAKLCHLCLQMMLPHLVFHPQFMYIYLMLYCCISDFRVLIN